MHCSSAPGDEKHVAWSFPPLWIRNRGKSCKTTRQIKSIKASHYKCIRLGMNLRMRLYTRIHSDPSPNSSWKSSLASSRPWSRAVLCHRRKWLQLGMVGKLHLLDARNSQFWIGARLFFRRIFQATQEMKPSGQCTVSIYSMLLSSFNVTYMHSSHVVLPCEELVGGLQGSHSMASGDVDIIPAGHATSELAPLGTP